MIRLILCFIALSLFADAVRADKPDANRLTYLDGNDPWYPGTHFPKLTTPQWVGEEGVEAAVILAIDDMRDTQKYEEYLRPILERLKQIDGRAPVSIMTNRVDPRDPQLQTWLDEGLSIEAHTIDHPCPLLQGGDFEKAKSTYDRCVDLLHEIPNTHPVAYRMPCCDSLNTVSPRFYAEIFNKTTEKGHFLQADTSVFNFYTSDDPDIPRELVVDEDGREKFLKYMPKGLQRHGHTHENFVNHIENYPYPYVIDGLCWEFPCMAPSDWSAQHYHGKNNPQTVADWKTALDITVQKQGVFTMVFHPHGWIKAEQVVEFIDHAVQKHGEKVKFLTLREAVERLNTNLLKGHPLRDEKGRDNGVRVLDVNNDGYMDVVTAIGSTRTNRIWSPNSTAWNTIDFPYPLIEHARPDEEGDVFDKGIRLGVISEDGLASAVALDVEFGAAWHFSGEAWKYDKSTAQLLRVVHKSGHWLSGMGRDVGERLRDLNGDGRCEYLVSSISSQSSGNHPVFGWSEEKKEWIKLPFYLPSGTSIITSQNEDAGLRFVDLNEDGHDDIVFSSAKRYGIWLFKDMQSGWSIEVLSGKRDKAGGRRSAGTPLPPIVRADGSDNGFFVKDRHLYWQNEHTADRKDLVARRSFNELLEGVEPRPKSPETSRNSIRTRPGFRVELVAAEPLVQDPVAFDWAPDGSLWVAEMADYPLGVPAEKGETSRGGEGGRGREGDGTSQDSPSRPLAPSPPLKPGGRIRLLKDTDGDGKYDASTVFLDGVPFPNGVLAWRGGVLVTAAPDIFFAKDTDGDGRADVRETLYTGFHPGNQQHRVNGFARGLDNWLYCANGDSGGNVKSVQTGKTVNISGRDLRIRPENGLLETVTGRTQFGRNRDDAGNWFGCNNSHPMWHFVLRDIYLKRNPHVAFPEPRVEVSETPGNAPVYPVSRILERPNNPDQAGRFTSACSTIVYRDDLFGPHFEQNAFIAEPVHNLVSRLVLEEKGVTFTGRRAPDEQQSEFLASSDNWFRPVFLRTGPDGALWIADMYRRVIEHPKWIPDEREHNLRDGHDKGRIYRVYPVQKKPRPVPNLAGLETAELVAALDSPNGRQRDMAQQLLVRRQDDAAVEPLERMVRNSDRPPARLHALCALDGLDAVSPRILKTALGDSDPTVRRHTIRLSEPHPRQSSEVLDALLQLLDDEHPHVQMQLAYSLGEWHAPRAAEALGRLALQHRGDRYQRAAVISSIRKDNLPAITRVVLTEHEGESPPPGLLETLMNLSVSYNSREAAAQVLGVLLEASPQKSSSGTWRIDALATLFETLDRENTTPREFFDPNDATQKRLLTRLDERVEGLIETATAPGENVSRFQRRAAVGLIARLPDRERALDVLKQLLVPREPAQIQLAAVDALEKVNDPAVPQLLLDRWRRFTPKVRSEVLDVLLSRRGWLTTLLDALDAGRIGPGELTAAHRRRLLEHNSVAIRQRAETLLGATTSDREQVIAEYGKALELQGDPQSGAQVFRKQCASCHMLEGTGQPLGPDLAALKDKSPQRLLTAVLDPNRAVEAQYLNYTVLTRDGLTRTGLLASETANSITVVDPQGQRLVILRKDIENLAASSKSFMPEGLEKELSPQDLADVIAFVRSLGGG